MPVAGTLIGACLPSFPSHLHMNEKGIGEMLQVVIIRKLIVASTSVF